MKLYLKLLNLSLAGCLALTGCAELMPINLDQGSVIATTSKKYVPTNPEGIKIYGRTKPNIAYIKIGEVTVNPDNFYGASKATVLIDNELRNKASEIGGDAVINVNRGLREVTCDVIRFTRRGKAKKAGTTIKRINSSKESKATSGASLNSLE